MTIFCGAISLTPNQALPDDLIASLHAAVSRTGTDERVVSSEPGFYFVKVDIGAFSTPAFHRDETGSITAFAGEPLISDGEHDVQWNRARDVALLHPQLGAADLSGIERCRGTFCGVHYDAPNARLQLLVDRVGVRPLYFWQGPDFLVFATALRILEAVPQVVKRFDVRGVAEIAAFSFALADRTPYLNMHMLRAGEVLTVAGGSVKRALYARWDGPIDRATPYQQTVDRSYAEFIKAISRRHRNSKLAAAFLSGGLDSRVIVGGLHANGSNVYTVNYAPDGSQDQVFAELVAKKLGIHYTQITTDAKNVSQGYRKDEVGKWLAKTFASATERAPMVWSGDGGSVALGYVYMTTAIVAAMDKGDTDLAIKLFTSGIAPGVFKRSARDEIKALPIQGIKEELALLNSDEGGRRFHLFLMLNDQRRHLARHFEDIDVERIEFQLPFFDADFLDSVLRLPNEPLMYHRFYMDWLARFPNGLDNIPWQAYPDHVPCTLPSPPGLKYQWDIYYDKTMYRQMRTNSAKLGFGLLRGPGLPTHLVSRTSLAAAALMTGLGLRDYGYMITTASVFQRYWHATR